MFATLRGATALYYFVMRTQKIKDVRKPRVNVCQLIKNQPIYEVTGVSMLPTYGPGVILGYREITNSKFLQFGQVHLFIINNQEVLRRVMPSEKPNEVILIADNKDYSPIEVKIKDIYRAFLINWSFATVTDF